MTQNHNKPKIVDARIVGRGKLFEIEELDLEFSNGEHRQFERLCPKGKEAVLIAPVLNGDQLLLVREYGAGIEDYYVALPKGLIDKGESAFEAADRELKEEVGYGANSLTEIRTIASSPGYNSNITRIIVAEDLYPEKLEGDEPEPVEVIPCPLDNLTSLLEREDFNESRSIAALFLVRQWLNEKRLNTDA